MKFTALIVATTRNTVASAAWAGSSVSTSSPGSQM